MMNILIVGLGALGTVYATFLKKGGHQVWALTKEKYLPFFAEKKVITSGIWGEVSASLNGISSCITPCLDVDFDLIILTVKSYDTYEAICQVRPLVEERTLVLVAQNGYGNYETVSDVVGKSHTLLARIIFGARLRRMGEVEVTVMADKVRIGQPHGAVREEAIVSLAEEMDRCGIPTAYDRDAYLLLWEKIIYNCALNPLGAILACSYGELAENRETRKIMDGIIEEIFLVARTRGISLRFRDAEEYREIFQYEKLSKLMGILEAVNPKVEAVRRRKGEEVIEI